MIPTNKLLRVNQSGKGKKPLVLIGKKIFQYQMNYLKFPGQLIMIIICNY